MPNPASTAYVEVLADLTRFSADMERGVRSAFGEVETIASRAGEGIENSMQEAGRSSSRALNSAATAGNQALGRVSTGFGGLARQAVGYGAAIAGGFAFNAIISESSDLNESLNAVNVTFGEAAEGILDLGKNAATSVGLSNSEFNSLAVQFAATARTVSAESGSVGEVIDGVTRRAADFASVMNLEVADAATLFQSALAGETEGMRRFGIDMSAAAVEAYAMANGIGTVGKELTEAEKTQARYGLLMQETANTQGDFANTSDGLANAMRIMKAQLGDLAAQVGTAFLPILQELVPILADVAAQFAEQIQPVLPLIAELFGTLGEALIGLMPSLIQIVVTLLPPLVEILNAVLPLLLGLVQWAADFIAALPPPVLTAIAGALATLWLVGFGPIGLVTAAIVALVALIVKFFPQMQEAISTAMNAIRDVVTAVWDAVRSAFETAVNAVKAVVEAGFAAVKAYIMLHINAAKLVITTAINAIVTAFNFLRNTIVPAVTGAFTAVKNAISTAINEAVGFVAALPGRAVSALSTLGSQVTGAVRTAFTTARDAVSGLIDEIIGFVAGLPGRAVDALGDIGGTIFDAVSGAFKGVWNRIIDTLPAFHADPLGMFGPSINFSFDFLRLANGGLFDGRPGGYMANIAEAGPEAVIPLSRPGRALELMDEAGLTDLALARATQGYGVGPLVSFPNATIAGPTDADLVAQRTLAALTLRAA